MLLLQIDTLKTIQHSPSTDLSSLGSIAQAIIAVVNVGLAYYIFIYQRRRDNESIIFTGELNQQIIENNAALNQELINNNAKLNEQNIKLQWFKELIVQPNLESINSFYDSLHTIKGKITTPDLFIDAKEDINNLIKAELAKLRKSFIDALLMIDKKFADQLLDNLDQLIDGITDSIFNDELKLSNSSVYDKHIGSKISYSRNSLFSQLYNYKGLSE